jgi:hypothetical protein
MNIVITNRELLRNYKRLKSRLMNGQIQQILIEQKGGTNLKLTFEKRKTPFQQLVEMVRENPIHIERPKEDLFDERG